MTDGNYIHIAYSCIIIIIYISYLYCMLWYFQLMEFLSDTNELAAADVLVFVREAIHRFESLRSLIITKLLEVFPSIRALK